MTTTATRTNGTAAGRTTASRLIAGDRILVEPFIRNNGDTLTSTTRKLTGKNAVVVATVLSVEAVSVPRGRVTFRRLNTDLGVVTASPSQTFALAPQDNDVRLPGEDVLTAARRIRAELPAFAQLQLDQQAADKAQSEIADVKADLELAVANVDTKTTAELRAELRELEAKLDAPVEHRAVTTVHGQHCGDCGGFDTTGPCEASDADRADRDKLDAVEHVTPAGVVEEIAQQITFGVDLPSTFEDSLRGLLITLGGTGSPAGSPGCMVSIRTYGVGNVVGQPVDYQPRSITTDADLTRDGQPHLVAIRVNSDGEIISRSAELIPLDSIHTVHVY